MTIGEVAKRAGLRTSAIRFYEKAGLLPTPVRSGGQRRFGGDVLDRLAVLQRAKDCGLTLEETRELFDGKGTPAERWQQVARRKIAELDEMAGRIARMRELLGRRCECRDLGECGRRYAGRWPTLQEGLGRSLRSRMAGSGRSSPPPHCS